MAGVTAHSRAIVSSANARVLVTLISVTLSLTATKSSHHQTRCYPALADNRCDSGHSHSREGACIYERYMYTILEMTVTRSQASPWLLLVFSLPARSASQRVQVWRKIQRYGMLALRSSGYVLPNTLANQERMEWLATAIRTYKGQASVVQVQNFDDLPPEHLKQLFLEARSRDYQKLLHEAKKVLALSPSRRPGGRMNKIRRRFTELQDIDFFGSPLRAKVENLLAQAEKADTQTTGRKASGKSGEYVNRLWMTRPRPGIDRVSSAWLIRGFIDPKARFIFGTEPSAHADAIPFDMFCQQGFGHRGEDCTFETLQKEFSIKDGRFKRIAQIIHDADLGDEKFGRVEGQGLDKVLNGWARQDLPDDELLQRGMDVIEGLYESLG
jgi:hypothetical protein